jgi:hypothetical protein
MTTASISNYGVILGKEDSSGGTYSVIGEVVSVDFPELLNPEIEATNHSSAGVREFISGGLQELSVFKAVMNYVSADAAPLITVVGAGTKAKYQVLFPNTQFINFSSLITGFKPMTSDAQSPDVLKAEITFRPTDSFLFMSS